jgi:hypothetical protein
MTKEEEKYVLQSFKELYSKFPQGGLEHIDSPDFIIRDISNRKIGIELTQAVHDEKSKQHSSEEKIFTDLVLNKLIPILPFHFSLSIDLIEGKGVKKSQREIIADQVADFCCNEFHSLENMKYGKVSNFNVNLDTISPIIRNNLLSRGLRNLPEGVKSINIFRFDIHGSSFNSHSEAAAIPYFAKERLDSILEDKEMKLQSYKPCDEYWLLIWQGGGITGYFQEADIETPIQSKFDKVFIVRTFGGLMILKP